MNNILVTGGNGQLGSEIREIEHNFPDYKFLFTNKNNLDITDHISVKKFIENNNINTIINCAAFTDVDKAESEIKLANAINHLAVANLAKLSKVNKIKLVHISSDYVFDGYVKKAYIENDEPNPKTVYGKTKLDGEIAIKKINPINSIIIRTSWLYSLFGNNFMTTMLSLAKDKNDINVVSDQLGSPTNARDLAMLILTILPRINNNKVELFHFANKGSCSWYEFAKAIFIVKNIDITLNPIDSNQYPVKAKRPKYSVLDSKLIKNKFDLRILSWEESLQSIMKLA
tara:strand:- start:432 stop:1289 length:858 start_codon:yes stop_codon:yes gene_type:complete